MLGGLFAIDLPKLSAEAVIQSFTRLFTGVSTTIILSFGNAVIAQARIPRIATTGLAVSIESDGNGVEPALVLTAGAVAFQSR